MLDIMDHNEPAVNTIKRCVTDLLRIVDNEQVKPVKEVTTEDAIKYEDIRNKLKEKDFIVTEEIIDSEKFVERYYTIQSKEKRVFLLLEEVKSCGKDTESIDEALTKTKEIFIIIEEVIELITIIEEILVIIKVRSKGFPVIVKTIDDKSKEMMTSKKNTEKALKEAQDAQNKMNALQQSNKELDQHIGDINRWLPQTESDIVKQTPVSANYDILKVQQDQIQVCTFINFIQDWSIWTGLFTPNPTISTLSFRKNVIYVFC